MRRANESNNSSMDNFFDAINEGHWVRIDPDVNEISDDCEDNQHSNKNIKSKLNSKPKINSKTKNDHEKIQSQDELRTTSEIEIKTTEKIEKIQEPEKHHKSVDTSEHNLEDSNWSKCSGISTKVTTKIENLENTLENSLIFTKEQITNIENDLKKTKDKLTDLENNINSNAEKVDTKKTKSNNNLNYKNDPIYKALIFSSYGAAAITSIFAVDDVLSDFRNCKKTEIPSATAQSFIITGILSCVARGYKKLFYG